MSALIGIACFIFGFLLAAWGSKEMLAKCIFIEDENKRIVAKFNELVFEARELRTNNERLKRIIKPERGKA